MCKLFIMTNTSKLKNDQLEKIVKLVSKKMSKSERDGFGISARTSTGIFNRRFLKPKSASLLDRYSDLPFLKQSMNEEGQLGRVDALILHGRTSTNAGGLVNTHPISKHGFHLSHNGVVEDSGSHYVMQSQNDTEHVVERFSQGIEEVEKHISGYYAFASFQDNTDNLVIVKDNIASLYFAEIPSLGCHVFATTQDLISNTLKALGISHLPIEDLLENTMLTYEGPNLVSQTSITPKGRSSYADSLASKSLGHELTEWPEHTFNDLGTTSEIPDRNEDPEELFFQEIDLCADHSWTFLDGRNEYSFNEFCNLSIEKQLKMTVIRADGTICSPYEVRNGKLWEGYAS